MSPYPAAFLPATHRLRAAIAHAIDGEIDRAKQEGMADQLFFEGVLNTLTYVTVRFACRGYFPERGDGHADEARVRRMQWALAQALSLVLSDEQGGWETEGTEPPDAGWSARQPGHA